MDTPVILISGIPGAGKTTVSRLLASRFERGVHIESDLLQTMIVSGGLWPDGQPREEAMRQLRLRGRNACVLARSFVEAGFTVVLDDVVIGSRLEEFIAELSGLAVYLVLLTPDLSAVAATDAGRPDKHVFEVWCHLDEVMRSETRPAGLWLDTSELNEDETVSLILHRLGEARL